MSWLGRFHIRWKMYRLAPGRAAALTRVVDAVGKMILFFLQPGR